MRRFAAGLFALTLLSAAAWAWRWQQSPARGALTLMRDEGGCIVGLNDGVRLVWDETGATLAPVSDRMVADDGPLQPVYGIGGERDLVETQLPHLSGFAGVGPVRIGNAAYVQTQHDVMGEMILCLDTITTDPRTGDHDPSLMPLIERLVTEAIAASVHRVAGALE